MPRPLDGHINRTLQGKTVERCYKNGTHLILRMTNGEEWAVRWADENGDAIKGEPCLYRVNVRVVAPSVDVFGDAGAA